MSELGVSMMHGHGATGNESGSMPGKAMDHSAMNMGGMDMGGMAMGGMMTHANDVKFDAYLANDRTPVSYTHLDVYKRQHQNRPGAQDGEIQAGAGLRSLQRKGKIAGSGQWRVPVSYTHLDVYKRQK